MSISNAIRTARMKSKLSREQLAKKLRVSVGYVGILENNSNKESGWVSIALANKLEKVLDVKLTEAQRERHNNNIIEVRRQKDKKNFVRIGSLNMPATAEQIEMIRKMLK